MVLESYGESIYTKLHDLAIAAGVADKDMPDETAAKAFIQAVYWPVLFPRSGMGKGAVCRTRFTGRWPCCSECNV